MRRCFVSLSCVLLLSPALLAGCEDKSDRLAPVKVGVNAPLGTVKIKESVDGLVVGHRLMAAGEFELALKAYRRATAKQGLNADVLSALGSGHLKLGRLGVAEGLLREAVKKDEQFAAAWNNLGVILTSTGRTPEAERVFKIAFSLDRGKSVEIRNNLNRAIAKNSETTYKEPNKKEEYELVRRGKGRYLLLQTPNSIEEQL